MPVLILLLSQPSLVCMYLCDICILYPSCTSSTTNNNNSSSITIYIHTINALFQCYNVHLCLYKAEKPSVYLSNHYANTSAISASTETGCAQNESRVFWDHKLYFTSLNPPVCTHISAQKALV